MTGASRLRVAASVQSVARRESKVGGWGTTRHVPAPERRRLEPTRERLDTEARACGRAAVEKAEVPTACGCSSAPSGPRASIRGPTAPLTSPGGALLGPHAGQSARLGPHISRLPLPDRTLGRSEVVRKKWLLTKFCQGVPAKSARCSVRISVYILHVVGVGCALRRWKRAK